MVVLRVVTGGEAGTTLVVGTTVETVGMLLVVGKTASGGVYPGSKGGGVSDVVGSFGIDVAMVTGLIVETVVTGSRAVVAVRTVGTAWIGDGRTDEATSVGFTDNARSPRPE